MVLLDFNFSWNYIKSQVFYLIHYGLKTINHILFLKYLNKWGLMYLKYLNLGRKPEL